MSFRRGFKTEAERLSLELRKELGLSCKMPVDIWKLAKYLEIPVVGIRDLRHHVSKPKVIACLATTESDCFSAMTIFEGDFRLIVHNDSHHKTRQSSNIAHEISHCVLEHSPTPAISPEGCRYWNGDVEDEANWLGAAILVPRDGALFLARLGRTISDIAGHYEVSEQLCRWRINGTGIAAQLRASGWRG